jgi:predicted Holliday junction resolvase-like endonuclease
MPAYLKRLFIKPVIYLLLSLLVLSVVVFQLQLVVDQVEQGFFFEQQQVNELYSELKQTTDDLALVQKYQRAFTQLKQRGLIGTKQRADWIDKFMEVVAGFQAREVSFELAPRNQLNAITALNLDSRFVHYEAVKFKANFQHEMEALSFLTRVKEQVEPLLLIDRCQFSLVTKGTAQYNFQYQPTRGNITLECQLYWLELQVPQKTNLTELKT